MTAFFVEIVKSLRAVVLVIFKEIIIWVKKRRI